MLAQNKFKVLLSTGEWVDLPYIVLTNNNGKVSVKLVPYEKFTADYAAGKYMSYKLLDRIPPQDSEGHWSVPENSFLLIQGVVSVRDFSSVLN